MVKAKKLLLKYANVFPSNEADIGKTGLVQHKINTGQKLPIRQRPRRLPVAREKGVETMIEGMVKDGVIEPSSSPWCSPVVLAKKNDGSMRFCVDYRRLNDVTKKDSYPLPRIDDSLDMLTGIKWFTTFERLMELVLTGLIGDACLVYLDDIIIVGCTFEEHLQNLERVLMKIQSANLKLSPKKCSLFKRQVSFLGYVVSEEGIRTDPEKIAAVKDWPVPKDKTQVRAFLGAQEPSVQNTYFGARIRGKEFIVDTDASDIGVGGVLSQRNGDQEIVIAYFNKSLSKPERKYCIIRRELLAVVKFMQNFSKYLLGRKFRLRTDHAALKWLLQFKNPKGQVARWIELLQEYDFFIEHRSGKSHGIADALSRRLCPEDCKHCARQEGKEVVSVRILRKDQLSNEWKDSLQHAQQEDSDIKPILEWMKASAPKPKWSDVSAMSSTTKSYWAQWDSLLIQDGVLCRKWENGRGDRCRLQMVVPKAKVPDVLQLYHSGCSGGHLGVK
ncbi:unnamed protein product [Parnassius mnemosyne]|uniref:Uncharacterized protein n=1 Tax=Parnassius mnemosyne TaxID=213953 RepID=A0AAV1M3Y9_9NEOP